MWLLVFVFLLVFAAVCCALALGLSFMQSQERKKVVGRLENAGVAPRAAKKVNLMRAEGSRDAFALLLERLDLANKLERFIAQSGVAATPVKITVMSLAMEIGGIFLGSQIDRGLSPLWNSIALGGFGFALPLLFVMRKRAARIAEFESQLPDALDFLGRSMRAGHGLSMSIELLVGESPEPLGSEFRKVANEMSLGSSIESSLERLRESVPLLDVRFFTSAVALQQVTGGNLSEILGNLAHVIRERFKLRADVRSASAHGKMTAGVLLLIPIAIAVLMNAMNPSYLGAFASQKEGKMLLIGAACGELIGNLVIWRMVNFKI